MKGRISNEKIQLHPYSPHPETPKRTNIATHTNVGSQFKLMDAGWARAVRSPPLTCAMIWKSIHVVKQYQTMPGRLSWEQYWKQQRSVSHLNQVFLFSLFLFMSGVKEDGRRMAGVKGGKEVSRKTHFTDSKHSSPLLFTKGYCRSKRLPAYTFSLCGCCGAVQGDADDYDTLYHCTWKSHSNSRSNWFVFYSIYQM